MDTNCWELIFSSYPTSDTPVQDHESNTKSSGEGRRDTTRQSMCHRCSSIVSKKVFEPGIEPGTLCVLGKCDTATPPELWIHFGPRLQADSGIQGVFSS
jgi:hypothetical protein